MADSAKTSIGIDFGGTSVKLGVCRGDELLVTDEPIPTTQFHGPAALIGEMAARVAKLQKSYPAICAIGVGVPGLVDFDHGFVHELTNVPGWNMNIPDVVRARGFIKELNAAQSSSYISGLLIGEEIKSAKADLQVPTTPLFILGNSQLTQRYAHALEALNLSAQALADEVTWSGIWALAHHLYPNDFKVS